jgi:hypothetical protein
LFGAEDAAVTRKGSGRLARWIALSERDVSVWKSRRDGAIHHATKVRILLGFSLQGSGRRVCYSLAARYLWFPETNSVLGRAPMGFLLLNSAPPDPWLGREKKCKKLVIFLARVAERA